MTVNCRECLDEIIECARRGAAPSARLEAHLFDCQQCGERWTAEQSVGEAMGKLRLALEGERSPEFRRRQLLEEFARRRPLPPRTARFRWAWAAAAAVVLLACAAVLIWRASPGVAPAAGNDEFAIYGEEGFVAVPYTPPLEAGESVRIVNREMKGAELARMGLYLPGAYGYDFDADVAFGEDGLPRAIRLNSEIPQENN